MSRHCMQTGAASPRAAGGTWARPDSASPRVLRTTLHKAAHAHTRRTSSVSGCAAAASPALAAFLASRDRVRPLGWAVGLPDADGSGAGTGTSSASSTAAASVSCQPHGYQHSRTDRDKERERERERCSTRDGLRSRGLSRSRSLSVASSAPSRLGPSPNGRQHPPPRTWQAKPCVPLRHRRCRLGQWGARRRRSHRRRRGATATHAAPREHRGHDQTTRSRAWRCTYFWNVCDRHRRGA
jgi:hypothetical protein